MENSKIAQNKKAFHDYFVLETYEAGIELFGTEVKSVRQGKVSMKDCYADVKGGEVFVHGLHISPYEKGNIFNKDPMRDKKLLLHKREIMKLFGQVMKERHTLIPLAMYWKGSRVKVSLGLCKGKKLYDKRAVEAKKSAEREIDRRLKERY